MKQMLNLAVLSVTLMVNFGAAYAQNMPTPKPEDGERNAFETPTAGKNAPENNKDRHPDANPESRMNDNPPPQERVGAPNTAPK
jgi:hypothetical protein